MILTTFFLHNKMNTYLSLVKNFYNHEKYVVYLCDSEEPEIVRNTWDRSVLDGKMCWSRIVNQVDVGSFLGFLPEVSMAEIFINNKNGLIKEIIPIS